MKITDLARNYFNTNNTFINITDLGQIISIAKKKLQWSAKPSEIFLNKANHDQIFSEDIPSHPRDIIFLHNCFRAMRRALQNYLEKPAHLNDTTQRIFIKQIVKAYVYYTAFLFYYQMPQKESIRQEYSVKLFKIASANLASDFEGLYSNFIAKVKKWYLEESNNLEIDLSQKKIDSYFQTLMVELGIDQNGLIPFSSNSIIWNNKK